MIIVWFIFFLTDGTGIILSSVCLSVCDSAVHFG